MSDCGPCSAPPPTLLLRGVDANVLAKLLQQHRRGGGVVERLDGAAPPAPPRAAEPGKGRLVDVVA